MKLASLSLAAALATLGSAPAFADTVILNGASASQLNVVKALRLLCTGAGGAFKVYKTSSSLSSLGNITTSTCTGATFDGGTVDQVRSNVSGGSLSAVVNSTGYGNVPVARIDPAAATCSPLAAGTGPISFLLANEMQNCNATGQVSQTGDGGFLDVEGGVYAAKGINLFGANPDTDFVQSNFLQAFTVSVSQKLYNVLQEYQVAQGLLDASCATAVVSGATTTYTASGSALPLCQPNVTRAQMTAIMNNINNNAKKAGVNFLLGGTTTLASDLPATKVLTNAPALKTNLTYCRRPNTSGTQASAELYFLSNPTATGDLAGKLTVSNPDLDGAATVTYNTPVTTTVTMNSGTSNVVTCLNGTADYAIGVVSAENNPIGTNNYRFAKVNGVSTTAGVAGDANTAEAIAGRYDFVYETFKFCPGGACLPVLDAIDGALPPGASSPGLFLGSEGKANRGGKSTSPYIIK